MQKMSSMLNLGGMGGMGMGMPDFGGMEEGDPFSNLTPEQMQQLQQLEQLRMQDPAAFEDMMNNMYR